MGPAVTIAQSCGPRHLISPAMMLTMAGWRLDHSYEELSQRFYRHALPTPVCEPRFVAFNRSLATMLGLEAETLEPRTTCGGDVAPRPAGRSRNRMHSHARSTTAQNPQLGLARR